MGLLKKIAETIIEEITTPETVKIGEQFEDYILSLFPKKYYVLEHRTPKYRDNKDRFIRSSLKPDFVFYHKPSKKKFAVECKFWRYFKNGKEWIRKDRLQRYKQFEEKEKVRTFIIIGLGEDPSDPDEMFAIPLKDIEMTKIYRKFLERYQRPPRKNFYFNGYKLT